jgi:hypothetical protein
VIVVFANSYDPRAGELAARWANSGASLLTTADLSLTGWRHFVNSPGKSTAVVAGKIIEVDQITGVLIRWPGVFVEELAHIVPEDRNYVAGEMMAFLVSWFLSLRCPVINRPTPLNLTGPSWRHEQWTHVAAKLDIPVRATQRRVTLSGNGCAQTGGSASVTVVGNRCFGDVDETLKQQARNLAGAAGATLLEVTFSGSEQGSTFTGANLLPEIRDEISDAVLELLTNRG